MADPKTFAKRVRLRGRAVEENATRLVRKVAVSIDSALVLATPVDTGRARSNWQVEINTPARGEAEPVSAQEAIDAAVRVVNESRNGDAIHITNNLAYIGKLNEGHSAQAPARFVEKSILNGVAQVKSAKLLDISGGDFGAV